MPPKSASDDLLTTGMCAKIAHCAPRTVSGWVDSGRLKGFRLPGSQDRRIHRSTLLQFLRDGGYPVDADGVVATNPPVLVFGQSESTVSRLTAGFAGVGIGVTGVAAHGPVDWFQLGLMTFRIKPCAIVLDDSWGMDVVRPVVNLLTTGGNPPFVVLLRDPSIELVSIPGVRVSFHAPVDPEAVVRIVVKGK